MKGKLFKLVVSENTVEHLSEVYESNDGRGNRQDSWYETKYHAELSILVPCEKWEKEYWKTNDKVNNLSYEMTSALRFLGNSEENCLRYYIPREVEPKWATSFNKQIKISKDIYDLLLEETHEEEEFGYMFSKKLDVAYFYLHSGIRGQYLISYKKPGIERHGRHEYFDKYVDLKNDQVVEKDLSHQSVVFTTMAGILQKIFPHGIFEWDWRYITPPAQKISEEKKNTTLGDLLKDAGLNL